MSTTTGPTRRSTPEWVALILASTVGLLLLAAVVTVGAVKVAHPSLDLSDATAAVSTAVSLMIGAVVGFLAGRGRGPV
jgi:hypothetical protein